MKLSLTVCVVSKVHAQVKRLEMLEFSREERICCTTHPKSITSGTQSCSEVYTFAALPCQIHAARCRSKSTRFVGSRPSKKKRWDSKATSSEHCRLLWKRCSENKISISYLSFITSLAHNHSLSVYFSTTEIVYCPREYNVANLFQRKKILLLENNSNHNQTQSKMLDSSFRCL